MVNHTYCLWDVNNHLCNNHSGWIDQPMLNLDYWRINKSNYFRWCNTSNIRRRLIGNELVDHSTHRLSRLLQLYLYSRLNTLRPRQNGRHFPDDIFKCIFFNGNVWFPIKISLNFVPKGLINNIISLVPIMAWRRPGDKPLSESMIVNSLTHICVTRPQWVNACLQWIGENHLQDEARTILVVGFAATHIKDFRVPAILMG